MPRRTTVLAASLLLAGCAGGSYGTRSAPTSSEDSWSLSERLLRSEADEVYELPARAPADEGPRVVIRDRPPGPGFPPRALGGVTEAPLRDPDAGPTLRVAAIDDRRAPAPLPPPPARPLAGWEEVQAPGPKDALGVRPVGGYDDRPAPAPGSGLDRRPATGAGAWMEADVWQGEAVPPTSPLR